ncbi:hypothetical protein ATK36_0741 [Amycolatopsis sulphurea]|uniref:Uncharacterized protein n=1 Tax=Amycolatopsis sulphurea TaxID=76022 RepID=A0A2A9G0C6_9PSEU|nr:hypothetical protein ATK36_0741 [Amycolatopsis sulphurea]
MVIARSTGDRPAILKAMGDPERSFRDNYRDPLYVGRHYADEYVASWTGVHIAVSDRAGKLVPQMCP